MKTPNIIKTILIPSIIIRINKLTAPGRVIENNIIPIGFTKSNLCFFIRKNIKVKNKLINIPSANNSGSNIRSLIQ
jgi:hypothetical protein